MATTNRLFQDFISFATDADPGSGGTSLSAPGLADLLVVASPDFIALTLDPEEVDGAPEIVWVSAHSSSATTATIVRGREGSGNRAHPVGTVVVAGVTVDGLAQVQPVVGDIVYEDTADITLSSSWEDGASVTFTKPNGWNTFTIVAKAVGHFDGEGGFADAQEYKLRVNVGGDLGSVRWFVTDEPDNSWGDHTLFATHKRTGLSSSSVIVKAQYSAVVDATGYARKLASLIEYTAYRIS